MLGVCRSWAGPWVSPKPKASAQECGSRPARLKGTRGRRAARRHGSGGNPRRLIKGRVCWGSSAGPTSRVSGVSPSRAAAPGSACRQRLAGGSLTLSLPCPAGGRLTSEPAVPSRGPPPRSLLFPARGPSPRRPRRFLGWPAPPGACWARWRRLQQSRCRARRRCGAAGRQDIACCVRTYAAGRGGRQRGACWVRTHAARRGGTAAPAVKRPCRACSCSAASKCLGAAACGRSAAGAFICVQQILI